MRAIGFRVEKEAVHYAEVSGTQGSPVLDDHDKIRLQQGVDISEALALLRTHLCTLFEAQSPDVVGVRLADRPHRNANVMAMLVRARVEGVVLEAAGAKGVPVLAGASTTLKSGLKTKTSLRDYVDGDEFRNVDLSSVRNAMSREAIVAAVSAMGRCR